MSSLLSLEHLQNEEVAYAWVEAHVWPNGPVCPHCNEEKRVAKMQGKATRAGLHKCYACRKQFRVTVGTIFEKSHVAMHLWLQAFYLIAGSKKGISANQLHRTLGVTLKTAWFMGHRIREAMRSGSLYPVGGGGAPVEMDETYFGKVAKPLKTRTDAKPFKGKPRGPANKRAVIALVQRGGELRSFHVGTADKFTVEAILEENVSREAHLMTDESRLYRNVDVASTTPCSTRPTSTFARRRASPSSTPTPSRATSRCSSVACAASISTVQRSICTAISRSSISAITTASRWK